MITADTITDGQILRAYAHVTSFDSQTYCRNDTIEGKLARDCLVALRMGDLVYPDPQVRAARARCAEAINAGRIPNAATCSNCGEPVPRSWDHLSIDEAVERYRCAEILNARVKDGAR